MNFLTRLLAADAPPNTTLQSAELSFRGFMPWWLGLILLVLLGGIGFWFYSLEKGTLSPVRRVIAWILRTALLGLLLFLLARPVLLSEFVGERPRGIALLLDNSQSMMLQDHRLVDSDRLRIAIAKGLLSPKANFTEDKSLTPAAYPDLPKDPSRSDMTRWVLNHPELKIAEKLAKFGFLRTYLVGSKIQGIREETSKESPLGKLLEGFKTDDAKTALADGIVEILHRKDGDLPSAIFAITDGQDNASKYTLLEAAEECKRMGIPLHLYGAGTSEGASLKLKEIGAPETMFVEDSINVPLRWRAQGFKRGNVEIVMTSGGKIVGKKEMMIQNGEDLRELLSFQVPKGKEKEENLDLAVTIMQKGSEIFKDTLTKQIRVVDRKIKVLYIEHSPRFEYKFLQGMLLRDRRIESNFLLVNADPKVANSGPPFLAEFPPTREKFFDAKYNLIILGDVAASFLGKDHMEWIKEFVQNRGGLVVISGRQHMPITYEGSPLAEVLPVEFQIIKGKPNPDERTQEYLPTLTEVGQRSDMLALADTPEESQKIWEGLPGFHWQAPIQKLKPGTSVLMVNPRAKMGEQAMPLLASHYYGKGQVLFLGTDETWRWRFNDNTNKVQSRFWGQIVYQFGLPNLLGEASKRVQFALEKSEAILDKPGSLYVHLVDKDFNPRKEEKVPAVLEHLDAKAGQERTWKVDLQKVPGRDGEYRVLLPHDRPGRFEVRVHNMETYTYSYRVELPPRHELEESGMNEKTLREMAALTNGRFYREEDLHQLPDTIVQQKAAFSHRQEIMFWNPLTMILFVLLITAEWLVRKFSNLS